jgi:anti-sigma factor ChrR (cupin superfamily)
MRINADYTRRAVERPQTAVWRPSPAPGVERRMLDRVGDEVAVATSVVRYAPGSRFPVHFHEKGEEFLVLDGVFSDDSGDYGPGFYVRNPPGTSHAPWTDSGTTILVKLRQFDMQDLRQFAVDTDGAAWVRGTVAGTSILPLHEFGTEVVTMSALPKGAVVPARDVPRGEEIYVVSGAIEDADGVYEADSWIRNPPGRAPAYTAIAETMLWIKAGHLHPEFGPDRSRETDSQ